MPLVTLAFHRRPIACSLLFRCGHQSLFESKLANDTVGFILHSALLVPYHSWRISHRRHHAGANHVERDQVFVPVTADKYLAATGATILSDGSYRFPSPLREAMEESPIGDLFAIVQMLFLGWPAYLILNIAGQDYGSWTNHFNPGCAIFSSRDYLNVVLSDVGIFVSLGAIALASSKFGVANVAFYYLIPYLFTNMWLVLITYMQHSDPSVPHYSSNEFTFVRGALCSIDRDYGIYNVLHHHIGDTHIAHHLFSQMPFYHAQEATAALRANPQIAPYMMSDNTPIFKALRRSWRECKFVDPAEGGVMYYRSLRSTRPKKV
jgi:omega-6 fatty acid desaturase / acyl-lipid omega-6 desaturase (Delta-12 desaturase)